jgi:lipid A ethanolaminephosphotransferase
LFVAAIAVLASLLVASFMTLFAAPYIFKPAITALFLIAAPVSYFTTEYRTVFDASMLRNVLQTDTHEVGELLTSKLVLYVCVLGILPTAVLWAVPIAYRPWREELHLRAKSALVVGLVVIILTAAFSQNIFSVFRQHRLLLDMFAPLNVVSASAELARKSLKSISTGVASFGDDVRKSPTWSGRERKSVTVLVVGETARADHFSLNGYSRATNPLLSKVPDLLSFTQVYSCGTNTAVSLPCMFSGIGSDAFSSERAGRQEGLLDMLKRAGFSVLWRENQAGCYGVCKRVPTEVLDQAGSRIFFERGQSLDENLLHGLEGKIDGMSGDVFIVLHMMGSHGPTYYKRYPPAFEHFKPACKESQFSRCELSEIINSYDNTLVYTDSVLGRLIELLRLKDQQGMATAMLYVSDHGESLGEANLYLHGLPYRLAPEAQKHVPLLVWLSPNYQAEARVDVGCLAQQRHEPASHDNLVHSVLGLLDVETSVYIRGLDIFAGCRKQPN